MTAALAVEQTTAVAPLPERNERSRVGQRTANERARQLLQAHRAGLQSRRQHDLLAEKLILHIDGSGDFQWCEIWNGQKIVIPRLLSEYRKTENLLRLVVDNAVAHHTTMPLRYFADAQPDRRSRDKALVDALFANHVAEQQDLNGLFSDALYMAMATGNCPVHRYWRYDRVDQYEPITYGEPSAQEVVRQVVEPQPGMIDCFVGNPFDTVFDRAAKRGSIHWCSYGRMLSAELVRATFPEAEKLEGSKRLPSASIFQRIARSWNLEGLGVHGSPVIQNRQNAEEGEELLLVICRETLPGWDAGWPEGRLEIIAVPGEADLRLGQGGGHAVLLADQPLPASDFSFSLFYSHHRGDDVLGKPWVEDIDQLQVDLNIAISKKWEYLNRGIEAPIVAPGGALDEDMLTVGQYDIMEIEPSLASWRPRAMEWPAYILQGLEKEAEDKRRAIYTGGGYQASSRGEAPGSRMAYRAILALQQADNTIHGPVNMRFRRSATDFMGGCWRQMKAYGDVPWMVSVVGDEYEHLVEPWVDSTKLSDAAPKYKLVNAFGPSPELRAQEVMELMQTRGADGKPFITTEEARRAYPNAMVFGADSYPGAVAKRRAKAVIAAITHAAQQFRDQTGFAEQNIAHPWVQRAAMIVFGQMEANYPRLRDDDLAAHVAALSEITQDETADPIARMAAMRRQALYFEWQASMAGMPAPQQGSPGAQGPPKRNELDPRVVAAQMRGAGGGAGAVLQDEESGSSPIAATARG